ncbi:MAG: hypothetical protein U0168_17185 [Nannocystaceae bacterium]
MSDPDEAWSRTLTGEAVIEGDGTVRTRCRPAAARATTCSIDVAVQDASFEEVGATATWFVYPSQYLAIKATERSDGSSWTLRAVDRDGKQRRVQAYTLELSRMRSKRGPDDVMVDVPERVKRCRGETTTSGDDARCDSGKLAPGRYRADLTATIDETPLVWQQSFWIDEPRPVVRPEPRELRWLELELPPQAPAVGQTLVVKAHGPTIDAHGVLAFRTWACAAPCRSSWSRAKPPSSYPSPTHGSTCRASRVRGRSQRRRRAAAASTPRRPTCSSRPTPAGSRSNSTCPR